jgi:hypothetical protein
MKPKLKKRVGVPRASETTLFGDAEDVKRGTYSGRIDYSLKRGRARPGWTGLAPVTVAPVRHKSKPMAGKHR